MRRRRVLGAVANAALLAVALVASGCISKTIRTPVYEENMVEVYLRHQERAGSPVERGYSHPATIAPVRITNLLARLEVRKEEDKERQPAIPTDLLYSIGDGISRSLAKADPNQEVVVMAQQRRRSMGIFTQDYLTSLLAWAQGDKLYVKLGQLDAPLSKDPNEKPKEPERDDVKGRIRAVPSDGISVENPQLVSASWRDPLFTDNSVISIRAGGRVVRRTVLMESEATGLPDEPAVGAPVPPQGLSPQALRALADLEEERRRGEVTEADYQSRRRQIVAGELPPSADSPAPAAAPEP